MTESDEGRTGDGAVAPSEHAAEGEGHPGLPPEDGGRGEAPPGTDPPTPGEGEPPAIEAAAGEAPGELMVVGVGASAGGLEALVELLQHLPVTRMGFIVVQHLAPQHESVLTELLARSCALEVVTAGDGATVEAGHVYVIPPGADIAVMGGVIRLITPRNPYGPRLPIDYLFRSLADDLGPAALGVVLSGTGSDGTFGLKAIKAAGGLTFVQEPSSAKYEGMPRSALASGAVDFSLTPKAIAEELTRIARHPRARPTGRAVAPAQFVQDQLAKLFVFLRAEFGTDLSHYKSATLERRIERRMMLHKIGRLDDYVRHVQSSRDELRALYKDLLISVTSFFRDPEVYAALKAGIVPRLLAGKEAGEPIRVWVPACATGEEAYSIAIILLEVVDERRLDAGIQIFGTDVDDDSIQVARRGVYPANIAQDVSPERLARFFVRKESGYMIARRVRDLVVFSKQNVLKDAPFSRMDLVSCRNLLIYLQPAAQKKVLRILHYALNPSGALLLGASETVGDAPEHFGILDRKHKIYAKRHVPAQGGRHVTFGVAAPPESPAQPPVTRPNLNLQALADRKVLELYGPPGVVINEDLEILQFRGRTGPFLEPVPGAASLDVLKLARIELRIELRRLIQRARAQQLRATAEVLYRDDGEQRALVLDVIPLLDPQTQRRCLLVLFHLLPPPREIPVVAAAEGAPDDAALRPLALRIQELERDLAVTRDYLQATIEEREGTNEELQAANEELQSTNEELQSTNEELETSKEELQSTNEELTTVNEELQNRMAELGQTNDDLHNVLVGVDHAVVIVGLDLRLRRFTAAAERLFNLVPADVGRSIAFLDLFLRGLSISDKIAAVIESLAPVDEEILAGNQRWYALKISPYKTLDHAIRGALVSLVDIDVRKRAAEVTRDVGDYAARFLAAISHPLVIVDGRLRVVWSNEAFLAEFQLTREETVGNIFTSVGGRLWADAGLRGHLDEVLGAGAVFRDYRMRIVAADGRERALRVGGGPIPVAADAPLVLLSLEPLLQETP